MKSYPLRKRPSDAYSIVLEGKTYEFRFIYLGRVRAWYVTVSDAQGPIVTRIKMTWGTGIFQKHKSLTRLAFTGDFFVWGGTDFSARIDRDSLGATHNLHYLTEEEILERRRTEVTYPALTVSIP